MILRIVNITVVILVSYIGGIVKAEEPVKFDENAYWNEIEMHSRALNFEAELTLLMASQGFGSQINFYQYLADYFQVGQSFQYYRQDEESNTPFDLHYGIDLNMRLTPFRAYRFSPYAAAAFGYNSWRDIAERYDSARVSYEFGLAIYLSDFFGINLAHHEIGFMDEAPQTYWGRKVEQKNFGYDEVLLSFRIDNRML